MPKITAKFSASFRAILQLWIQFMPGKSRMILDVSKTDLLNVKILETNRSILLCTTEQVKTSQRYKPNKHLMFELLFKKLDP